MWRGGFEIVTNFEICSQGSILVRFPVVLDWRGVMFSSAVILISASVIIFSSFYIDHEIFHSRFVFLVILFVLSINFLIFIPRLFGLMIGWDGLGVISFLLVIFYQNKRSLGAGIITVLTNRIGDVLLILRICCCMGSRRWVFLDLSDWTIPLFCIGIIIIGRITKRAQIPFSAWLPAAIAAPTPVSALVHSSTLVTAGVYVLIRFRSSIWGRWGFFLLIISLLTIVIAGIRARFECDFKKVIALSTLSQLGVIILVISLGSFRLCIFHLITHALFKALIFICAGAVIHLGRGVQDARCFSGLWYKIPIINSWLLVSCCSLIGVPFIAGFYSKDLILELGLRGDRRVIFLFFLTFGTFLTAFYGLRFIRSIIIKEEFSSYRNFNIRNFPLIISSSVLGVGAIFGGFRLQNLILDLNIFVFTSRAQKLSIPLRVIIGILLRFMFFFYQKKFLMKVRVLKVVRLFSGFLRKIWFLPFLRGEPLRLYSLRKRSRVVKNLDAGWLEHSIGGLGVYEVSKRFRRVYREGQSNLIGVLFLVFVVVIFLLLTFSLFLF